MGKNGRESTFNPKNKYATVKLCLSSLEEKNLKLDIPEAVMPYIVLKTTKLLGWNVIIRACALLFGEGRAIKKVENKLGKKTYKKFQNDVKLLINTIADISEKLLKEGIFVFYVLSSSENL